MADEEEQIRDELSREHMIIAKGAPFNINSFVALSRENTSVHIVELYPFDSDAGNYEFWGNMGQIVGNLMELQTINIHFLPYSESDDGNEAPSPDWEILARILRYLRRKVTLCSITDFYQPEVEEIQGLGRVIHGHPMISELSSLGCSFKNFGPWCSALATLPSLESVILGLREPEIEDQRLLVNPEPLTELLRAPALRFVVFYGFSFTYALCHATAIALEEKSSITDIIFADCSFPDGGTAIIANALKMNTSVTNVRFLDDYDEPFCKTLAEVLLYNSTLQNLTMVAARRARGRGFSSIFLSLGMDDTALESLHVSIFDKFGDKLCAAIRNGLAKNSTLEALSLDDMVPSGDDGTLSASNVLSFLRTNVTLKSLTVFFVQTLKESYVSAFLLEAVKMLENTCIESLTIHSSGSCFNVEEIFALISALQLNTTLKTLFLRFETDDIDFTVDEVNQLVSILIKNYGLECLMPDIRCVDDRRVKAILRLNGAGRRYLIKDGASVSKGVEVLSAVNDDINCLFLHLLENPGLCNRRAVETETTTSNLVPI
jgi:hypothetical protein